MQALFLGFVACVEVADGRSALRKSSELYVHKPHPEGLSEMKSRKLLVNSPDWKRFSLSLPGHKDVSIYGYPSDQDTHVSQSIATSGTWETSQTAELCRDLEAGARAGVPPNFLDVGANIGAFALPLAGCIRDTGKAGTVFAVEAMPEIAKRLKAGVIANSFSNVEVYEYAVGRPEKEDTLRMVEGSTNKGASTVKGNKDWSEFAYSQSVGLTTLDAMMSVSPDMKRLLVAKLDIEGSEGVALAGAEELFSKHPPCTLLIEMISEWLYRAGTPAPKVVASLQRFGYDTSSVPHKIKGTYVLRQKDMPACLARVKAASP